MVKRERSVEMLFVYNFLLPVFLVSGLCSAAQAAEYHLLELDHASMEYSHLNEDTYSLPFPTRLGVRDSYLAPVDEELTFGLGLNLDYNLIRVGEHRWFWRNHWGFDSARSHVRHVWWQFDMGLSFYNKIEFLYRHMSRHILEDTRDERFPVRDEAVIRFIIFDKGE